MLNVVTYKSFLEMYQHTVDGSNLFQFDPGQKYIVYCKCTNCGLGNSSAGIIGAIENIGTALDVSDEACAGCGVKALVPKV